MRYFRLISPLFIFVLSTSTFAQQNISLNAQIRHRYEIDKRDFNSDTGSNNFSYLRSRLGIAFNNSENLNAFLQIQDSRKFGEETSTLGDGSADNIDVHQAYFKLKNFFDLPLDVKLGRMEVIYGPQRLIGAVDFHNVGRSFDGVIFKFHFEKSTFDFFAFQEDEDSRVDNEGDFNIYGIYSNFNLTKTHTFQPFIIWQRANPSENFSQYTAGFYSKGKLGNLQHEIEFAYQGGSSARGDISAMMAAVNLAYTFTQPSLRPQISAGVDILSGDDDTQDDELKAFNTLYATNHKYYGFMDYFLNIPFHTMELGLVDIHAKLAIKPSTKTSANLAYHIFNAQQEFVGNNGSSENGFGNEIDITLQHKYDANVNFVAGASLFIPGKIFEQTRGKDSSTWFFLMTVVNL